MRHGLDALGRPVALLVVVRLAPALGRAGDDGNEKPAMAAHRIFEVAFEVVAADEPVVIEPDQAAGCPQFLDDPEGGCRIAGGVRIADKDRAVGHHRFHERNGEVCAWNDAGRERRFLSMGAPAKLAGEGKRLDGKNVDAAAKALVEHHGVGLAGRLASGEQEVFPGALRERTLANRAQEEAHEPVGQARAQDHEIVFGEGSAKRIQRWELALELPDELNGIRVPEKISGIGRSFSEEITQKGAGSRRVRQIHGLAVQ